MTRFPHAGRNRGKKRPAVIIQADVYNAKLKHFLVAEGSQYRPQAETEPGIA